MFTDLSEGMVFILGIPFIWVAN